MTTKQKESLIRRIELKLKQANELCTELSNNEQDFKKASVYSRIPDRIDNALEWLNWGK